MTLIPFPAKDDHITCTCGSPWFTLERTNLQGTRTGGAVNITPDGRIVAWSGELTCNDCGAHP